MERIKSSMDIKSFITEWIRASNAFEIDRWIEMYTEEAILDDPSVGRKFMGHAGIRDYFTSYFIGYNTQTRLLKLEIQQNKAHLELEFTGTFPEGKIKGMFELTFKEGKIATAKADLI